MTERMSVCVLARSAAQANERIHKHTTREPQSSEFNSDYGDPQPQAERGDMMRCGWEDDVHVKMGCAQTSNTARA